MASQKAAKYTCGRTHFAIISFMSIRHLTPLDRLLASANNALRTVAAPAGRPARPNPAEHIIDADMDPREKAHAAGLMRVNHAGEVAAQGLYQGHAAVARDRSIEEQLQHAADEEFDHLAWCEQRINELGEGVSKLAPVWYAGAFAIGAASGMLGDKWSLGFVAETERQVETHLEEHIAQIPPADRKTHAILEQMKSDEIAHATKAVASGGAELPGPVKLVMKLTSKVMTRSVYHL